MRDNPAIERMHARAEIVAAFECWWPAGRALVPALREWCSLYRRTGAGISEETRAAVPSVAWNTLQRWRLLKREYGCEGLISGKGGRRSGIEVDAPLRAFVVALLASQPAITARRIQEAVAARFPNRPQLHISTVRRFARRWRADNRCPPPASLSPYW